MRSTRFCSSGLILTLRYFCSVSASKVQPAATRLFSDESGLPPCGVTRKDMSSSILVAFSIPAVRVKG